MWLNIGLGAERQGETGVLLGLPTWGPWKCAGLFLRWFRKQLLGEVTLEIVSWPEGLLIHQICIAWQSIGLVCTDEGDRALVLKGMYIPGGSEDG